MIRVLRVLEYEFDDEKDYERQFNRGYNNVPLQGTFNPAKGVRIKSAIFLPTVEKDENGN